MNYLLDTCTVSELQNPSGDAVAKQRIAALPRDITYLSVLTMGEISKGIKLLQHGGKRDRLQLWYDCLLLHYQSSILSITLGISERWADILAAGRKRGANPPAIDALIAATALHHGLTVVTRNEADFQYTGVQVWNPWHQTSN